MHKFTANYCYSNSNFVITNLPHNSVNAPYTNIIRILQNIIMRGVPTIASEFLRSNFGLKRNYLDEIKKVKFISKENLIWKDTIKGNMSNNDYPAVQFYDDLEHQFGRLSILINLIIAEYPISDILPDVRQAFDKQRIDHCLKNLYT